MLTLKLIDRVRNTTRILNDVTTVTRKTKEIIEGYPHKYWIVQFENGLCDEFETKRYSLLPLE